MSPSITIHPVSDHLDMYGQPDTRSAYSLSGHVTVSVSSPRSLFDRRRVSRLLIHSLSLTFEGQSEIFTPDSGYSAARLCTISRELLSSPMELSNEGDEESDAPVSWNFIFNLPIPGWLPPTTSVCYKEVGVCYALYATAKYTTIDDEGSSMWSLATLCTPFRSRTRKADILHRIRVRRFINHPSASACTPSPVNYLVNAKSASTNDGIPIEILSKIQVLASVPEYVSVEDDSGEVVLRLRTKDMDEETCKRLQVTEVSVDLVQREKFRRQPTAAYMARYPLPPADMQPPHLPLRDTHSINAIDDIGVFTPISPVEASTRSFSLLHPDETGVHKLADNNYVFKNNSASESAQTWYTMEVNIPFTRRPTIPVDSTVEWAGTYKLRPSVATPLYTIYHEMSISITCSYDAEGRSEPLRERLSFCIPFVFAKVAPQLPTPRSAAASPSPSLPMLSPLIPNLPPYSQLYHTNGDRKIDYTDPLPLYTPRSSPSTSTTASEQDSCTIPYDAQLEKAASFVLAAPVAA